MASSTTPQAKQGNAYNIFILVLTIFSLIIMVLLLLPLDDDTLSLLRVYDNVICVIFLIDFAINLIRSRPKREYFLGRRGWLDLLGSIPSLGTGVFRFTALFRLARLSRLVRITRVLGGKGQRRALIEDVLRNRGQYALFITILSAILVLTASSLMMIQFESRSDGNIQTGGDALWWSLVTVTTVGYGDTFPITALGRFVAVLVMFAGVGIIGSLASILASFLVSPSVPEEAQASEPAVSAAPTTTASVLSVEQELAAIRQELIALRRAVVGHDGDPVT